jgi:hypothetical protein
MIMGNTDLNFYKVRDSDVCKPVHITKWDTGYAAGMMDLFECSLES